MMGYTHDECYDTLLTRGTRSSRFGTRAWKYALRYRTLMYLAECSSVAVRHENTLLVSIGCRRTVRTVANTGAIIAAVERELC